MKSRDDITALILASGYSTRMGQFKPLLPLGPVTVLERSARLFPDAGITDVRVVVGYRAEDLTPQLQRLGIRWVVNDRFQDGMFSSVQAGVRSLESTTKAFFVLPADLPLVRRSTVVDLLNAYDEQSADVLYPCFLSKRGHPPLISAKLRSGILSWEREGGLRSFLSEKSGPVNVEVADEHILLDMDSPADYDDLCGRLAQYHLPSPQECLAILTRKLPVSQEVFAHSKTVARVALHLVNALNKENCRLNTKLVVAAALLHDLAKGNRNHASVAAQLLTEMDYAMVAGVVGSHMNMGPSEDDSTISERDVVYLADKLVEGDRVVALDERYRKRMAECAHDSNACQAIAVRMADSLKLKRKLEAGLGSSIELFVATLSEEQYAGQALDLSIETR
jgi:molybdenum cofactor cytidylyltransferase